MVRAKEIALSGTNVTLNAADRSTLAADAKNLAEQLLGYANRTDSDGGALFGGARRQGPAYAADTTGKIVWQGAGSAPALALDNTLVATGVEGPAAFAGIAVPGTQPQSTTDAFQLLSDLQSALAQPDMLLRNTALATVTDGIDSGIGQVADTRALVGARLNRLDNENTRIDAAKLQFSRDLETSEGIDLAGAIARLQRLTTVLSATQQSFVRVTALSLWDDLR
jgi:flagellar hook-associated protein 3 FlgL